MSDTIYAGRAEEAGRLSVFIVYGLYILSIPSAALFAPLGVIVAYASRSGAGPIALSHLNRQIRVFWIAFIWGAALFLLSLAAWVLTVVLIGFPILWLIGAAAFIVMLWFTIVSILGAVRLLDRRAA